MVKRVVFALFVALYITTGSSAQTDSRGLGGFPRQLSTSSDGDEPIVGIGFFTADSADEIPGEYKASDSVQNDIITILESDGQVKVVGDILMATLLCDSLAQAEDASTLRFSMRPGETFTAEKTSYSIFSEDTFTDGIIRKVWSGDVIGEATLIPSTVRMVWGTECDPQTFLLKKVSQQIEDKPPKVLKTITCEAGESTDICIVEVDVTLYKGGGAPLSPDRIFPGSNSRQLRGPTPLRNQVGEIKVEVGAASTGGRQLQQAFTNIDILVLYTERALAWEEMTTQEMEQYILDAFGRTNVAMANSKIDLKVTVVGLEQLPCVDENDDLCADESLVSNDILDNLEKSDEVATLRNLTGADLVHLITTADMVNVDGNSTCGRGNQYTGGEQSVFSVTAIDCLDDEQTHSHEVGHNLGCSHNIEEYDDDDPEKYAYGYRYCSGDVLYRTLMSYGCDESPFDRINHYSNPDVFYDGLPTGVADEADCARRIRETMVDIADFRTSRSPTPVPTIPPIATTTLSTPASSGTTCSNGIPGVEAFGECCTLGCGTCGGVGCGARATGAGLTAADCCVSRIRESLVFCEVSRTAPCIIDSLTSPTPTPTTV